MDNDKIIYNISTDQFVIFDSSNNILVNTFDDIDFNSLPSNIFNNIDLYFGKDYECYDINYQDIIDSLINDDDIIFDEKVKWYKYKSDNTTIYSYYNKTKELSIDLFNLNGLTSANYVLEAYIIGNLCKHILSKKHNWEINKVVLL